MLKTNIISHSDWSALTDQSKSYIMTYLNANHAEEYEDAIIPDASVCPQIYSKKTHSLTFNMDDVQARIKTISSAYKNGVNIISITIHSVNCLKYPVVMHVIYSFEGNTYKWAFAIEDPTYPGDFLNENRIARWRYVGKAITVYNNTAKLYVRGTMTSCQFTGERTSINTGDRTINAYECPISVTDITAMKSYYQCDAAEGTYIVPYNPLPVHYYIDSYYSNDTDKVAMFGVQNGIPPNEDILAWNASGANKLTLDMVKPSEAFTDAVVSIPIDNTYSSYNIKFTQAIELVPKFNSKLMPYANMRGYINTQLLLMTQKFIIDNNGLYPASYNSMNKLFEKIKTFFKEGKWIEPVAGIVSMLVPQLSPAINLAKPVVKQLVTKNKNAAKSQPIVQKGKKQ